MRHIIVEDELESGKEIILEGDDHHHVAHVLRIKPSSKVIVLDGAGLSFLASVLQVGKKQTRLLLEKPVEIQSEAPVDIHLFQSLPKGDRFELVLEKACEAGVSAIFPLITARTVKTIKEKSVEKTISRWQKIIKNAAQQSGRLLLPSISPPLGISRLGELAGNYDLAIVGWEQSKNSLGKILKTRKKPARIMLIIGPEGSFTAEEMAQMNQWGIEDFNMGPRILRSETAGIMAVAALLYHYGGLEGRA